MLLKRCITTLRRQGYKKDEWILTVFAERLHIDRGRKAVGPKITKATLKEVCTHLDNYKNRPNMAAAKFKAMENLHRQSYNDFFKELKDAAIDAYPSYCANAIKPNQIQAPEPTSRKYTRLACRTARETHSGRLRS